MEMRIQDSKIVKDRIHELKTWPKFFQLVKLGFKDFEVRKNDRDYQVDDVLRLKEYDPESKTYTGEHIDKRVLFILEGGQFGIEKGYVVMQLTEPGLIIESDAKYI